MGVSEKPPGGPLAPKCLSNSPSPYLRITIITGWRDFVTSPPRIKGVICPFDVRVLCHIRFTARTVTRPPCFINETEAKRRRHPTLPIVEDVVLEVFHKPQTVKDPPTKVPTVRFYLRLVTACKLLKRLEAAIGIEPMNKGFADLCLTTWLRRPGGRQK